MKKEEAKKVHLLFDPDGKEDVVVRYVRYYGDIIKQFRFKNLDEAIKHITEQGE